MIAPSQASSGTETPHGHAGLDMAAGLPRIQVSRVGKRIILSGAVPDWGAFRAAVDAASVDPDVDEIETHLSVRGESQGGARV